MPKLPLTQSQYDCKPNYKKQSDRDRATAEQRGYGARWQKIRSAYLSRHPLCERCRVEGRTKAGDLVHHKDRNPKNNSYKNLESMCISCHDIEHKNERFRKRNGIK